jgi:hypothetical protein
LFRGLVEVALSMFSVADHGNADYLAPLPDHSPWDSDAKLDDSVEVVLFVPFCLLKDSQTALLELPNLWIMDFPPLCRE